VKRILGRENNLAKKGAVVTELENNHVRATNGQIGSDAGENVENVVDCAAGPKIYSLLKVG